MVEYIVKYYNNESSNCIYQENIKKLDIKYLNNNPQFDVSLIVIERTTSKNNETTTVPSLVLFNKTIWELKRLDYMHNSVKLFLSNGTKIIVNKKARAKHCSSLEEMLTKLEKNQTTFYFMDKKLPNYEDFYKKHHKL